VYPALAVLQRLIVKSPHDQVLWVGGDYGMEAELVQKAGVSFEMIPAAGVHGVGIKTLPGNLLRLGRGYLAARRILRSYSPDVLFFTGGYVAVPMALAGMRIPSALFVPDIEPGLALRTLARFSDHIVVTTEDSRDYFPGRTQVTMCGYPTRPDLTTWDKDRAYQVFGLSPDLPTLLVTGGSQGSRSINTALVTALPALLVEMQIIHLTGSLTWPQFENVREGLPAEIENRYRPYPYLHEEMGAAYSIADLVLSRAGASCLGEYPLFGLPAVLVPYPYAWRYQKVNADYLVERGAAIMVEDESRRMKMSAAMKALSHPEAADGIAELIQNLADPTASRPQNQERKEPWPV
jgi:UDP-N-acetylglucosamine:LPS N-acetylglucosamine transferase